MKIMPIMTNKNDCLQKKQSKPHTPSFNGHVKTTKDGVLFFQNILSVARQSFLWSGEKFPSVSRYDLDTVRKFNPKKYKEDNGKIVFEIPKCLDSCVERIVAPMKDQIKPWCIMVLNAKIWNQ